MTKEEFLSKRNAIQEEYKRHLEELDANYADENNEVSIGGCYHRWQNNHHG